FLQLTGYTPEERSIEKWKSIVTEIEPLGELKGKTYEEAIEIFRTGAVRDWRADYHIRTKDGRMKWVRDSGVGLLDDNGTWLTMLGTLQDVTEERKNQQLRESLAELGAKLSAATTPKEAALVVSRAADKLLGWDACFVSFYSAEENKSQSLLVIDTIDGVRR